ncbi:MAG: M48 family metalloprotease [Candidatus Omnitrophica bacterium]|nr:M48 family metalloprotease [Candidatus Omnitrophota bacterium]
MVTARSPRAIFAALAAAWLAAGCATGYNAGTSQEEMILIATDREVRMGASIAKQIQASKEFTVSNDPAILERLDRLGQRLAAVSDRQDLTYHFTLLEWDQVNAFAIPGGYIYVSSALIELTRSDEELASVLGHEIGHVVAKHAIKRLQASLGATVLQALTMVGSRDATVTRGAQIALNQLFLAHSRQDELEADTLSVRYLQRAGYNPEGAIAFMERMQGHLRKEPSRPFSYSRTHPHFDDRIRVIKQSVRGQVDFEDYINMSPESR